MELLRQYAGASRYWYTFDGRGNVVALTDPSGNVVDRYGYDVWGAPLAAQTSESVPQPFQYASYWYDKELGWYWITLRSYDPGLKHWLQPDPGVEGGGRDYVSTARLTGEAWACLHTAPTIWSRAAHQHSAEPKSERIVRYPSSRRSKRPRPVDINNAYFRWGN